MNIKEFLIKGTKVVINHFGAKIYTDNPDIFRRVSRYLDDEGYVEKDSCGVYAIFVDRTPPLIFMNDNRN